MQVELAVQAHLEILEQAQLAVELRREEQVQAAPSAA